jgi:hypothetical protein
MNEKANWKRDWDKKREEYKKLKKTFKADDRVRNKVSGTVATICGGENNEGLRFCAEFCICVKFYPKRGKHQNRMCYTMWNLDNIERI